MAHYSEVQFAPAFLPGGTIPAVPSVSNGQGLNGVGVYFVDGANGNDGYDGSTPQTAYKTLDAAYNACFGGRNEIIYVLASGTSVNFSSAIASGGAGLVWSKNFTHLVGLGSYGASGQRAHISNGASTNLYTPMIEVRGNGCIFQNVELFNGGASATAAAVCLLVTGNYNVFNNCQISGGGHTTSATNAACRSLVVTGNGTGGGGENTFYHCYIGLSTIIRNTTSSEVEFTAATVRNVFEDCTFITWSSSTGTLLVKIGAAGIQSSLVFRKCLFIGNNVEGSGATPAQALSINAAPGGVIVTSGCLVEGCTKVETTACAHMFAETATSMLGILNTA
jgi:hypothetical protein